MIEHLSKKPDYPEYGKRNLDVLYGHPDDAKKRKEFEDRGLIPTNNLNLYIVDDPEPELAPGIPNRHDYRQRSFGPAIEKLRQTHPELWDRAKVAIAESQRAMAAYSDALADGNADEVAALEGPADEAMWAQREACDEIFRIIVIAPELEAAGIDPIEACL